MATVDQIASLRLLIADPDGQFSDEQLGAAIDEAGTVKAAAGNMWTVKAASYAELVDVSESGSSRGLGSLHQNALRMAASFDADESSDEAAATGIRIRRIVRP